MGNTPKSPQEADPVQISTTEDGNILADVPVVGGTLSYADELYIEMGHIPNITLPDVAINKILRNFSGWSYGIDHTRREFSHFLRRGLLDPVVQFDDSDLQAPGRQIRRTNTDVTIGVERVVGSDIRCLIDIERRVGTFELTDESGVYLEPIPEPVAKPKPEQKVLSPLEEKFRDSRNEYAHDSDMFTERELLVVEQLTHHGSHQAIADVYGVSKGVITATLQTARRHAGVELSVDLMVVAIDEGVASIDHVPAGLTRVLSDSERELIAQTHSPNPDIRKNRTRSSSEAVKWYGIYNKLEAVSGGPRPDRREVILYAIKDGIIALSDK